MNVIKVLPDDDGVNFFVGMLWQPDMQKWLNDYACTYAGMFKMVELYKVGYYSVYAPLVDGVPIGMCYGSMYTETEFMGHMVFNRESNGELASEAMIKVRDFVFNDLDIEKIIGFTPVANRVAIRFILRNGWKKIKVHKGYDIKDGKPRDCLKTEVSI